MRKLQKDNNGISVGTVLLIIVIILIPVLWEFGAPLINEKIPVPSDLINAIFISEDDIIAQVQILDSITNEIRTPDGNNSIVILTSGHSYDLILNTNAPYKLTGQSYRFLHRLSVYNTTSAQWEILYSNVFQMPFSSIWANSFIIDLPIAYGFDWRLDIDFFTPSGNFVAMNPGGAPVQYLGRIDFDGTP